MTHIKKALKKVILERLSLVRGYRYYRYHLNDDGDYIVIWKDEDETHFVAKSNMLRHMSFENLQEIPLEDRMIWNSVDRVLAIDYFIEQLENLDNE